MPSGDAHARDTDALRVLALLDDTVVSGKVKPVLTLARHIRGLQERRRLDLSMLTFVRGDSDPDFVLQLRREGFSIDVVRERRRFDLSVFPQLRAIFERRRPQVLWTHGAKTNFLVRVAALHRGTAWVASHHGYTATSLVWTLYDQLDRWTLRGADAVTAACEAFSTDLNSRLHISSGRLSVHRSPIERRYAGAAPSKNGTIRAELGLPADSRIVLSVGRLSKEKGHADLIRAMLRVRPACDFPVALAIVGDGPELAHLQRLVAESNATDFIRFAGYRSDVSPFYEAAEIFVLPSYSEGSPNVILEAMDAGVPIVATAVGGIGEMIRHGKEGSLVRSGDPSDLANGIVSLLTNPALSSAQAAAARRSLDAYSPAAYFEGMASVFERVSRV